ncbi:DNA polymerase lambda [Verticillium dahliae VdLs.17]|uniref:DNA polymerase n=1 Tax=Verticillium dahliae (strain VdLs.17 / ATCC MYA-4575 / FGSC 10137) TaxID=498257 RepID=G2X3I6_VERDV|nr:DNA polymerase lambda [Verticillium dahliae VdLs.17]EGY23135.1 DNA polymerase lambda [Verticillium dahliae VdLs.17]KAH6682415.1 DNA polymerase lambda [Verticillium dahliae]KAH6689270.1 DNA polymerase lambda [Verticillium dahliae]
MTMPPIPAFLRTTYSCQRPTPANPPNNEFVEALKEIRTTRKLLGDEIGVRAYSTAIATVAAYPYAISTSPARLPGCGSKIAELYHQWKTTGSLGEIDSSQQEARLPVFRLFYNIWGVGDTTAREFYKKGWRDLDDLVEYGWDRLSRVQQIGVKYYDEFLQPIPRHEVEAIAATILRQAQEIEPGFQLTIVGGHRRGKKSSGDVDVILSHADEDATYRFIERLVASLEKAQFITHTLTLSTHNSERGQKPLTWKADTARTKGAGFDTLDKAMVVWQEPGSKDSASDRPHRRVDIIISPWKTVGCAVLGWSGGTTFQRDVRRYCKKELGYKFDSSGIRKRSDGSWVDLERGNQGTAPDMVTAEQRVFEGLGLDWQPPEQRCTG